MKGVANFSEPGDIDLAAFLAGNDVMLISEDVPKAMLKMLDVFLFLCHVLFVLMIFQLILENNGW